MTSIRSLCTRSVRPNAMFSSASTSTSTPIALLFTPPSSSSRMKSTTTNPWPSKTHLRPTPSIPAPLPAIYPQRVVLSDGSTFTSYTTAPTPAILRLTRDVTNNPLWAPGTEKRGLGEGAEEGRVGRFRRRFEMESSLADAQGEGVQTPVQQQQQQQSAFGADDLDWMSVGATEEKISEKQRSGPQKVKNTGKKR